MKNHLHVVKVGGAIVEDEVSLRGLLDKFQLLEGRKLLLHGGGRLATKTASLLGIESKLVEGRRITDIDTLKVVTMVYGGLVNKKIVALLQSLNINAIGLTGADAGIILSHKRPVIDIDYGFVGDVDNVNATILSTLIENGLTPVIAPLTHDGKGNILNTNADTMAKVVAQALSCCYDVTLTYCFEKPGVLANPDDDNSLIRFIDKPLFEQLSSQNIISGGMIPKVKNALDAIDNGVSKVIITKADLLGKSDGTTIVKSRMCE